MKKIFIICMTSLMLLYPISASAINKDTLSVLKERNYTGIWADKDLQDETYYLNGVQQYNLWVKDDSNKWYYFGDKGTPLRGWQYIEGKWYYLISQRGYMHTGWLKDGSNWYYLNQDGTMAHDTYIGNYYIGSNGVWVQ